MHEPGKSVVVDTSVQNKATILLSFSATDTKHFFAITAALILQNFEWRSTFGAWTLSVQAQKSCNTTTFK